LSRSILCSLCLLVLSAALLSACTGKTLQPATQRPPTPRELEEKLAELQLHVLEQEAQIGELQKKLEEAIQEVVRAKAKLHTLESKAETASTMAEAEIALKALKARMAGQGSEAAQAEELLKMSAQEFEKKNYGGALYLVSQATGLIKAGEARLQSQGQIPARAGELLFAVPLSLRVLKTSNVREGPGPSFKVLFTLERGIQVVGHSYKGQWVRVEDQQGRAGWVFYGLVEGL
jgi:uncharacterized protein YgiM (DUF1202 family)